MASHMASSSMRADAKICCIFLGAEQCHGHVTWCRIPKVMPQFGITELNITPMIWDDSGKGSVIGIIPNSTPLDAFNWKPSPISGFQWFIRSMCHGYNIV